MPKVQIALPVQQRFFQFDNKMTYLKVTSLLFHHIFSENLYISRNTGLLLMQSSQYSSTLWLTQ